MNLIEAMNEAFKGKIIQTIFANTLAYRMNPRGGLEAFHLNGKPLVEPHNCNILSKDEINAKWRIVEENKPELSMQKLKELFYKVKYTFDYYNRHLKDLHSVELCGPLKDHEFQFKKSLKEIDDYLSEIEKK